MLHLSPDPHARKVLAQLENIQESFAKTLVKVPTDGAAFLRTEWLRQGGVFGGGHRLFSSEGSGFNRASINISQVHYPQDSGRSLASATALSTIVHPDPPLWPSFHMHCSWTKLHNQVGYWRWMVDLNPSLPIEQDCQAFDQRAQAVLGSWSIDAQEQGAKYFYIPALNRTRGVSHYYLEQFRDGDFEQQCELFSNASQQMAQCYVEILRRHQLNSSCQTPDKEQLKEQLEYHSLYAFQVLTLDRGTTSGLLVHQDNDLGILASLPRRVDPRLWRAWKLRVNAPFDQLLDAMLSCVTEQGHIRDHEKLLLAAAVRTFFGQHPVALDMQARADQVPPTVKNHR